MTDFIFLGSQITVDSDCSRVIAPRKKSNDKPRQSTKKQRHYFAKKSPYSQNYDFSNSHVWMWELHHKESWTPKNWCFQIVVLEKTLECPLDCMEIKPFNPKGNQSWIFIGRTDAEASILWPPNVKSWLFGKDPDAEKDWRWEEKGKTEDEMVDGVADSMDVSWGKLWELVMPSNPLVLCCPLLLPPSIFLSIRVFPMSQFFTSGGQSIGASASVLLVNTQDWFPLGLNGLISLQSKGLSRVFSNTTVQNHQFFGAQFPLWSNSYIHTWLLEKPWLWLDGPLLANYNVSAF